MRHAGVAHVGFQPLDGTNGRSRSRENPSLVANDETGGSHGGALDFQSARMADDDSYASPPSRCRGWSG